jgi:ankyrin repeat protein
MPSAVDQAAIAASQEEARRKAEKAAREEARKKADEAALAASAGKVDQATIATAQTKYQGKKAPLCAALEAKDEESAMVLLDGGADPNEVDGRGRNALHIAAWNGCRPPLFQRVVARIHDVNTVDRWGTTALMYAACKNHLDVVMSLMNHPRIDLNVQGGWNNRTALHHAVFNNHPAIVSQLLSDDKMDASLKDNYNRTALKSAIFWDMPSV